MAGTFKDLLIWQKGLELLLIVYKITASYPKDERYGLVDQTRRSSNSIIALVAESHGRYHYADKCRVLYQARGECEETQSHLLVAERLGYVDKKVISDLEQEYEILGKRINSYINSIKTD